MTMLSLFQQAGAIFLLLLFLFLLGNLWFHLVEGLLKKIKGILFPKKEVPWHTFPKEEQKDQDLQNR